MDSLRQIASGFLLALLSILLVLGGFSLSKAEGMVASNNLDQKPSLPTTPIEIPSTVVTESIEPTPTSSQTTTALPSATIIPTSTPSPSSVPEVVATLSPTSFICTHPAGWIAVVVRASDSLFSLAQTYGVTQNDLKLGNCLTGDSIQAGSLLYVKPRPTSTIAVATYVSCGPPFGWVSYYIVPGDTLYSIGQRYGVTVSQLQRANCLGSSFSIQVGGILKVPDVSTIEPWIQPTEAIYNTETPAYVEPTATDTPFFEFPTPTPTYEIPIPTLDPNLPSETPITGLFPSFG